MSQDKPYKNGVKKLYIADLGQVLKDGETFYLMKIGTWASREALNRFYGPSADPYYKANYPDIKISASLVGGEKDILQLEHDLLKETEDSYFNSPETFSGCTEIRMLTPLQRKELLTKVYDAKDKVKFF